jgi:hypothetical protein
MYIKKLIITRTRLLDQGIQNPYDYELHIPMPMEKDKLSQIIKKYPSCLWRSMYGNLYSVGGSQMEDVKVYVNKKHIERSSNLLDTSVFLSTEDQAFKVVLDAKLLKLFPNPSKYELY